MLPGIQDKNRQRELINLINDSIQRLLKLVDQTLNLSRIENDTLPLSVCRQDILPVVERMMAGFACYAREKRIDISLTATPPGRMTVAVDTDKFSKILSNLISNALKYTASGSVTIAMDGDDLCIRDTGMGIAAEDLPRIFEQGFTGVNGRRDQRHRAVPLPPDLRKPGTHHPGQLRSQPGDGNSHRSWAKENVAGVEIRYNCKQKHDIPAGVSCSFILAFFYTQNN